VKSLEAAERRRAEWEEKASAMAARLREQEAEVGGGVGGGGAGIGGGLVCILSRSVSSLPSPCYAMLYFSRTGGCSKVRPAIGSGQNNDVDPPTVLCHSPTDVMRLVSLTACLIPAPPSPVQ